MCFATVNEQFNSVLSDDNASRQYLKVYCLLFNGLNFRYKLIEHFVTLRVHKLYNIVYGIIMKTFFLFDITVSKILR